MKQTIDLPLEYHADARKLRSFLKHALRAWGCRCTRLGGPATETPLPELPRPAEHDSPARDA